MADAKKKAKGFIAEFKEFISRGNIRFRRESTGKPEFLHTLNGSGLATSRIFPAMVEQNQLKDGSVKVPEVLQKYLGGLEAITR